VKNTSGRGPRSAPRRSGRQSTTAAEARETATDRFEFARRHIVHQDKLKKLLSEAEKAHFDWLHTTADGYPLTQPRYSGAKERLRKSTNPDERAELKALEAAVVAAKARLLLHENDGRNL
jgi:hypothetical protein